MDGLLGHAVIMLATLGCVSVGVEDKETGVNARSNKLWAASAGLTGWGGAGLIHSKEPTC